MQVWLKNIDTKCILICLSYLQKKSKSMMVVQRQDKTTSTLFDKALNVVITTLFDILL